MDDFHPDKPFQISSSYKSISKEIRDRFEKKNLQERLIEAKKVIQESKIGISEFNPQQIYDDFKQCFFYIKNKNQIQHNSQKIILKNQEIAIKILKIYTRESCFYQFINNLLGIMNQDLLIVLWDIILCHFSFSSKSMQHMDLVKKAKGQKPRYLDKISECPGEKEYLLNCGSVFKIKNIQEKEINQVKYTFVELKI
ncbi:hypothetical protein ABPG72_000745 [Tetrahymena utriculariae]